MREPWRISFPKMVSPWDGRELLVLSYTPIPGELGGAPTHAEANCFARNGRPCRLVFPLAELEAAERTPACFIEAEVAAAPGTILDFRGRSIRKAG